MKLAEFRKISDPFRAEVAAVFKKYGLELLPFKVTVDETTGAVFCKMEAIDPQTGTTPDAERYKANARFMGMKVEWLNQPFENGRHGTFKIIGMKARGDKCVLLEGPDGKKSYTCTPAQIIALFARKEAASAPPTAKAS
jgi:hypothetical protein